MCIRLGEVLVVEWRVDVFRSAKPANQSDPALVGEDLCPLRITNPDNGWRELNLSGHF